MLSKITMVLELLADGKWHRAEDLRFRLELSEHEFRHVAAFLGEYDIVKSDEKNRRVKINKDFRRLLTQAVT